MNRVMSSQPTQPPPRGDRRRATERRQNSDRRRGGEQRYVVLEIDGPNLRLAVSVKTTQSERRLLITRTLTWQKESSGLRSPAGAEELTAAIRQITAEERLSGAEAILLLAPPLCVTRTATAASAQIDKQLKELEERGHSYLALGGGQVTMASRAYQLDARHEHALLSIASRQVVEAAAEATHAAGLQLKRVESSTVSLCRTHGLAYPDEPEPTLLVSLSEHCVWLGVTQQGRLLLEYLPGGSAKPADLPGLVEKHLKRIQRFCARKHMGQFDSIKRLYLAGPDNLTAAAHRAFGVDSPLQVGVLDLSQGAEEWETRGEPLPSSFAATLGGAALKDPQGTAVEGPNLLEKWIRESRKHQRPILLRAAAPLAAVLLLAVGTLVANSFIGIKNRSLAQRVAEAEPVKGRFDQLRLELLSAEKQLQSLGQLAGGLPTTELPKIVSDIGHCLPDDVWLERLTVQDSADASLLGAGFSESGVYEFVGNLERAPSAGSVSLQETGARQDQEGPVTSFNLTATFGAAEGAQTTKGAENE